MNTTHVHYGISSPSCHPCTCTGADVFFGSLLFDYDQVEWLRTAIAPIPLCFVFESALELMSCNKVGTFQVCYTLCLLCYYPPIPCVQPPRNTMRANFQGKKYE